MEFPLLYSSSSFPSCVSPEPYILEVNYKPHLVYKLSESLSPIFKFKKVLKLTNLRGEELSHFRPQIDNKNASLSVKRRVNPKHGIVQVLVVARDNRCERSLFLHSLRPPDSPALPLIIPRVNHLFCHASFPISHLHL